MTKFIIRRLLLCLITFLGITIIVFGMTAMAPGSPIDALLADPGMTIQEMERRSAQLGLDQPLYVQYFTWLGELLKGNLGFSYRTSRSVNAMIGERLGPTMLLTFTSLFLAYLIAIPIGIASAKKPYSLRDYVSSACALITTALPGFFMGMVFIYIFSLKLGALPVGGMYSSGADKSFLSLLQHLILPALCLTIQQLGNVMRQTRSNMLEVLNEDYTRTAHAKGLNEFNVVYKHALRNAMIPIVTLFGTSIPFLIGGAVVTEQVFSWPGIGMLMVSSIQARDYPVIMGITVIVAIAVLLGNLLVDIAYGFLDPRIRYD